MRPPREAIPTFAFTVEDAAPLPHAALPSLQFTLQVQRVGGAAVQSLMLGVQIRIQAARRSYDDATRERLTELFGAARDWANSAQSVFWTQTTLVVPGFENSTSVQVPIACTSDFDVGVAKYFHAVREGVVPLIFLFSGTAFYQADDGRMLAARLSWDGEATFRLPTTVWDATISQYYPNSRWMRLNADTFDRLDQFRVGHTLPTWDHAIDRLLDEGTLGSTVTTADREEPRQ